MCLLKPTCSVQANSLIAYESDSPDDREDHLNVCFICQKESREKLTKGRVGALRLRELNIIFITWTHFQTPTTVGTGVASKVAGYYIANRFQKHENVSFPPSWQAASRLVP